MVDDMERWSSYELGYTLVSSRRRVLRHFEVVDGGMMMSHVNMAACG
jgi:hypothetical protein